ncbi:MAG: hypothetical protein F7C33_00275 [Desulfurococcales archaeon]|nr:hypothetical protein [Desulfurococcales archaeon]
MIVEKNGALAGWVGWNGILNINVAQGDVVKAYQEPSRPAVVMVTV